MSPRTSVSHGFIVVSLRAGCLRIEHGGLLQDWESCTISIIKYLIQYIILKEINYSI